MAAAAAFELSADRAKPAETSSAASLLSAVFAKLPSQPNYLAVFISQSLLAPGTNTPQSAAASPFISFTRGVSNSTAASRFCSSAVYLLFLFLSGFIFLPGTEAAENKLSEGKRATQADCLREESEEDVCREPPKFFNGFQLSRNRRFAHEPLKQLRCLTRGTPRGADVCLQDSSRKTRR